MSQRKERKNMMLHLHAYHGTPPLDLLLVSVAAAVVAASSAGGGVCRVHALVLNL